MADEVVDPLGTALSRQRKAVTDGQFLMWRGMIVHRQIDEILLSGLDAQMETFVSAVEMTVAGTRGVLDPLDRLFSEPGERSTVRDALDQPLELALSTAERTSEQVLDFSERWAAQLEDEVRERILALNSRLNSLLRSHEELEQQLREVAGEYDDPTGVSDDIHERLTELGERVRQLRERVVELRETLERESSSAPPGPA